jgi:hypothetical protein
MIPESVFWIWGITLALVTFVVVPLALYLLHRALLAARSIERYTCEALEAATAIQSNTAATLALQETIAAARSLQEAAHLLEQRTAEIAAAVAVGPERR